MNYKLFNVREGNVNDGNYLFKHHNVHICNRFFTASTHNINTKKSPYKYIRHIFSDITKSGINN